MEYQKIFNTKSSSEQEQKVKGIQIKNSKMTDVNPCIFIISVNGNGLNNPLKTLKLLEWIKKRSNLCCLQKKHQRFIKMKYSESQRLEKEISHKWQS